MTAGKRRRGRPPEAAGTREHRRTLVKLFAADVRQRSQKTLVEIEEELGMGRGSESEKNGATFRRYLSGEKNMSMARLLELAQAARERKWLSDGVYAKIGAYVDALDLAYEPPEEFYGSVDDDGEPPDPNEWDSKEQADMAALRPVYRSLLRSLAALDDYASRKGVRLDVNVAEFDFASRYGRSWQYNPDAPRERVDDVRAGIVELAKDILRTTRKALAG